jgi:hypothetical protein
MSQKNSIVEKTNVDMFLKTNNSFENNNILNDLVNINNKLIALKSSGSKDKTLLKNLLVDLHNYSALAIISMGEPLKKSKSKENTVVKSCAMADEKLNQDTELPVHIMYFESKSDFTQYEAKYYKDKTYHCTCKGFKYHDWCWHCDKLYKNHC